MQPKRRRLIIRIIYVACQSMNDDPLILRHNGLIMVETNAYDSLFDNSRLENFLGTPKETGGSVGSYLAPAFDSSVTASRSSLLGYIDNADCVKKLCQRWRHTVAPLATLLLYIRLREGLNEHQLIKTLLTYDNYVLQGNCPV